MAEQRGGTALKRRGLIAGAAALVAGIAASRTAQQVAAISGGGDEGNLVLASNPWYKATPPTGTNASNQSYIATVLQATPNFQNFLGFTGVEPVVFKVDASTAGVADINGVVGRGKAGGAGLMGLTETAIAPPAQIAGAIGVGKGTATGIYGQSDSGVGGKFVNNDATPSAAGTALLAQGNQTGVSATSSGAGGTGVSGQNDTATGVGVRGISSAGSGVYGQTDSGTAIFGDVKAGGGGTSNTGVMGRVGVLVANSQDFTTGVHGHNQSTGTGGVGVRGDSTNGNGVVGTTSGVGTVAGVLGSTTAALVSDQRAGTAGMSNVAGVPAVYGHAIAGDTAGIYGSGANKGAGVFGINSNAVGIGVQGFNDFGPAVQGNTSQGTGVKGIATSGTGMRGDSVSGSGVIGVTSSATNGTAGIFGSTAVSNGTGLAGQVFGASTTGAAAFVGAAGAGNYAAFFTGDVHINGKLVVSDPSYKSGMLKHATDGTNRLVYCVESPESWIEDFGTGTLTNGKADVKLDPDFAAVVQTGAYHVFLAGVDDHNHLIAKGKGPGGFAVEADAEIAKLKGKKASDLSGTFSYRVVAKPRTDKKLERLATYTPPTIRLPDKPLFDLTPPAPPKSGR